MSYPNIVQAASCCDCDSGALPFHCQRSVMENFNGHILAAGAIREVWKQQD